MVERKMKWHSVGFSGGGKMSSRPCSGGILVTATLVLAMWVRRKSWRTVSLPARRSRRKRPLRAKTHWRRMECWNSARVMFCMGGYEFGVFRVQFSVEGRFTADGHWECGGRNRR